MNTLIPGIDVSAWQPHIHWRRVAEAGNRFAFIKASEGASYRSPLFASQRAGARAEGLLVGAYHFARWEQADATAQAEHFVRCVGDFGPGTLPPVLDLEWCSTGKKDDKGKTIYHKRPPFEIASWAKRWIERTEALTGRKCLLYTGRSFWSSYLPKTGADVAFLRQRHLWTVDYSAENHPQPEQASRVMTPRVPVDGWPPTFVQWTGKGHVPGITKDKAGKVPAKCDRNWFYGPESALQALAGLKPLPASLTSRVRAPSPLQEV